MRPTKSSPLAIALFALLASIGAAPSSALDFSSHPLLYSEDFEGETAFPTTPEVDPLGIGDGVGLTVQDGLVIFPAPAISSGHAVFSINGLVDPAPASQGVLQGVLPALPPIPGSIGMRARFEDVSATPGFPVTVGVEARYQGNPSIDAVSAFLFFSEGPGASSFVVRYDTGDSSISDSVTLSAAAEAAIEAGGTFTIDFEFRPSTYIANASIEVEGVGETTLPPLDTSFVATFFVGEPLARFTYAATNPLPSTAALDVQLLDLAFYDTDSVLPPQCGDGLIQGAETCDDGNITPGDGCNAICAVEPGYTCTGEPSVCADEHLAYEFGGADGTATPSSNDSTLGWEFSLSDPAIVTELGFWDEGAAGLGEDHHVGLWDSGGSLIASATITNGSAIENSTSSNGQWRFESIPQVELSPGNYILGAIYSSFGPDSIRIAASGGATAPDLTYVTARSCGSCGAALAFPSTIEGGAVEGGFGPNLKLRAPSPAPVPGLGPIAVVLLGLALASAGARFSQRAVQRENR